MKTDIDRNEIEKLEKVLNNFKQEWGVLQNRRSFVWRKYFVISLLIAVVISMVLPSLWWSNLLVIGYFAGSLFAMLRQNAKTSHQITEHQKQLKLARLLRNS